MHMSISFAKVSGMMISFVHVAILRINWDPGKILLYGLIPSSPAQNSSGAVGIFSMRT